MQTRKQSFIETICNIIIGFFVALLSQMLIFPIFDIHVSIGDNFLIGLYFTAVGVARHYTLRRLFNRLHGRK